MDTSILKGATVDTSEPSPTWMSHEIAKMTTDSVDTCRNVSNWLMKRLSDNSANVKRKVLLIIKYVAKNGESDFARNVVLHSEEIKKCTMFKGPTDPIHGDSFNKAVREAAKEAISAVFERSDSTTNSVWMKNKRTEDIYQGTQTTETFSNIGQSSSNNYGDHYISGESSYNNGISSSGGSSNGGYSQNGLTVTSSGGIGPAQEKEENATWSDWTKSKLSNAVSYVKNTNVVNPVSYVMGSGRKDHDKLYLSEDSLRNGLYNGNDQQENVGNYRPNPSWNNQPSSNNGSTWNNGGIGSNSDWQQQQQQKSWNTPQIPDEPINNDQGSYKPDPEWNPEPEQKPKKQKESKNIWNAKESNIDGGAIEKILVDEITQPSSKLQPTRQQLNDFCNKTKQLDISSMAVLLDEKLNSSNWQVKLRTLYCIESLLKAKCSEIGDYFFERPESIQNLMDSTQEGINSKSQKIAKTLNIPEKVKVEKPKKPKKQPIVENDLFEGMVTKEEEGDLFDGMETKEEKEEQETVEKKRPKGIKKLKSEKTKQVETVEEKQDYLLEIDSKEEIQKKSKPTQNKPQVDSSNLLDEFFGSSTLEQKPQQVEKKIEQSPQQFVNSPIQYQPTSPSNVQYVSYPNQPQTVYIVQQRRMPQQQQQRNVQQQQNEFSFLNNSSNTNANNDNSPFDFIQQEMNTRAGK
eukprot:gene1002-9908_t